VTRPDHAKSLFYKMNAFCETVLLKWNEFYHRPEALTAIKVNGISCSQLCQFVTNDHDVRSYVCVHHLDLMWHFIQTILSVWPGGCACVVVKALCYKLEGRGLDTRWGDFLKFTLLAALGPGVYAASNRN
jgi:hypothetical protein